MIYLTFEDLKRVIQERDLEALTQGDDSLLDDGELSAIEEMTSYLSIRHDCAQVFDIAHKKQLVAMYLCDIMLYHLFSRISPRNVPELRENRYSSAIRWLTKIADGALNADLPTYEVGENEEDTTSLLRFGSSKLEKQDNHF